MDLTNIELKCNHLLYSIWGNFIISVIDSLEKNHFFSSALQLMIWNKQTISSFPAITMGLFFLLFHSFRLLCVLLDGQLNDSVSQTHSMIPERNHSNILICYCKAINPCTEALVRRGEAAWMEHLGGPRVNAAIMPKWVNVGFQRSCASHAGIQCMESSTGGGFASFLPISLLHRACRNGGFHKCV